MHTQARILAIQILRRVLRGAFLAPELRRALDASDLEGPDRSFVTDLSYGTVRRLDWIDAALAPRLRAPERLPERTRAALRLGTYDLLVRGTPRHAAVHAWVEAVKAEEPNLAGLANAVLRRVEAPRDAGAVRGLLLPAWLAARFEAALGQGEAERAARAMWEAGPLWLRSYGEGAAEGLADEGCEVRPGPIDRMLRVRAPVPLDRLGAYRDGLVQPQNPASALPALALEVRRGERVLDLAAGNGIKTAQLAAAGATVTAVDVDPRKEGPRRRNLARLGLEAEHVTADLTRPVASSPADAVLLDAPCTGTGTLRGHPEIKLRLTPQDVDQAAARQRAMLDTAAVLTAPGGRLVYAVCSLTDAEGEVQVRRFLQRHADFESERVACPVPHVRSGAGVYVLPEDGLDGFYVARLRRRGPERDEPARAGSTMAGSS